jgi:hypothetical protein
MGCEAASKRGPPCRTPWSPRGLFRSDLPQPDRRGRIERPSAGDARSARGPQAEATENPPLRGRGAHLPLHAPDRRRSDLRPAAGVRDSPFRGSVPDAGRPAARQHGGADDRQRGLSPVLVADPAGGGRPDRVADRVPAHRRRAIPLGYDGHPAALCRTHRPQLRDRTDRVAARRADAGAHPRAGSAEAGAPVGRATSATERSSPGPRSA